MTDTLKAACVQLNVGHNIQDNLKTTVELIKQAADQGAKLIATPENTCFIDSDKERKMKSARPAETHPAIPVFADLAKELSVWLCIGSLKIKDEGLDRLANRTHLFSPDGKLVATYDKIHLYDVDLDTGETWRESNEFRPGEKTVITPLNGDGVPDGFNLGLTICYDVRFAHLYRDLAKAGANIFTVPAAFTVPTGKAHWEVMLRARAIECGAFVLAPAQGGDHEGHRVTYGHSMMIGPWGEILAHLDHDEPGIITADLDLSAVTKARAAIQQLRHDRDYKSPNRNN